MGLSPKFRGGPRRLTGAPVSAPQDSVRPTRPVPERTEPIRAMTGALRQEAPPAAMAARPPAATAARPPAATTPSEDAVAIAYQVFDRFLEEGRRFAEGQSAWYSNESGQPDLARDAARAFADFLGVLGRMAQEVGLPGLTALNVARPTQAQELPPPAPAVAVPRSVPEVRTTVGATPPRGAPRANAPETIPAQLSGPKVTSPRGVSVLSPSLIGVRKAQPEALAAGRPHHPSNTQSHRSWGKNIRPKTDLPRSPYSASTTPLLAPPSNIWQRRAALDETPRSDGDRGTASSVPPSTSPSSVPPPRSSSSQPPSGSPQHEWERVASTLEPRDPRDEPRWPSGPEKPNR
jgi:hypothetical protein